MSFGDKLCGSDTTLAALIVSNWVSSRIVGSTILLTSPFQRKAGQLVCMNITVLIHTHLHSFRVMSTGQLTGES